MHKRCATDAVKGNNILVHLETQMKRRPYISHAQRMQSDSRPQDYLVCGIRGGTPLHRSSEKPLCDVERNHKAIKAYADNYAHTQTPLNTSLSTIYNPPHSTTYSPPSRTTGHPARKSRPSARPGSSPRDTSWAGSGPQRCACSSLAT
jgi:hypothetical protein